MSTVLCVLSLPPFRTFFLLVWTCVEVLFLVSPHSITLLFLMSFIFTLCLKMSIFLIAVDIQHDFSFRCTRD